MRWRLAAVSAGLTLVILLVFGGVIGQIATSGIRDDFNSEVSSAVQILASEIQIVYPPFGDRSVREARSSTTSSSPTTPRPASSTSTATCSQQANDVDAAGTA